MQWPVAGMQWQVSEVSEVSEKVKIGTAAAFGLLALPWRLSFKQTCTS